MPFKVPNWGVSKILLFLNILYNNNINEVLNYFKLKISKFSKLWNYIRFFEILNFRTLMSTLKSLLLQISLGY